jgi:hypothetical protein
MENTVHVIAGMIPQVWILLLSLAGFAAGYVLCRRLYSKKLVITLIDHLEETFDVQVGSYRFKTKTLDDTLMIAENYLTLQLLRPDQREEVLGLQQIFLEKGEDALFSAAREKGAEIKWCWRCRKELPILHDFCTACAWHGKFEDYYEEESSEGR